MVSATVPNPPPPMPKEMKAELKAMADVADIMRLLSAAARSRVLDWTIQFVDRINTEGV